MKSYGSLTFHDAIEKQVHKTGFYHSNPKFMPILNYWSTRFLDFQIQKPTTGESIIEILLINYDTAAETDLTSDAGFTAMGTIVSYEAPTPFEIIKYEGDTLDATLVGGAYYLKITLVDSTEVFYSDVFIIEV